MSLRVTIELAGDKQLNKELGIMSDLIADFRPAWIEVSDELNSFHEAVFKKEGQHGGFPKWADLKPSTLRTKRTNKILTETKALRKSMTKDTDGGAIRVFKRKEFLWGTAVSYAGFHQTGTKRMAKRSPLRINNKLARRISKTLQKFYFDTLRKVAGGDLSKLERLKRQARSFR